MRSASSLETYQEKVVPEGVSKIAGAIRGKLVILFGEPFVGKTSLAHRIANFYKKTYYIAIDRNFPPRREDDSFEYYWISSWTELLPKIRGLSEWVDADTLVVIDSLTTITEDFLRDKFDSPRRMNELSRFYAIVLRELTNLKNKGATVLVLTHEAIKDFKSNEIAPSMNKRTLKNADLVLRMIRLNGKRKVVVWGKREIPKEADVEVEGL